MFSFFNGKEKVVFPIGELLEVDIHSHILPGVDDGSPDTATSARLVAGLADVGFHSLITTPHITADLYPNDRHTIQEAYDRLAHTEGGGAPEIRFAAEYMLDEGFGQIIADRDLLPLGQSDYVLVETSFLHRPLGVDAHIFDLQNAAYKPVLAHPERYHYLFGKPADYEELKTRGCLFQVNILSLIGYYGKKEQEAARWLLDADMVDFLGSDLHHDRHLQHLLNFKVSQKLAKTLESRTFLNNTIESC